MVARRLLPLGVALLVSFVNLMPACFDEEGFEFSEQDVKESLEGRWEGTLSLAAGGAEALSLALVQDGAATQQQPFCGSRSFIVRPAGACMAMTTMSLRGTVAAGVVDPALEALAGEFFVYGTRFDHGDLNLGNDGYQIDARYEAGSLSGTLYRWQVDHPAGTPERRQTTPLGTFVLSRRP